MFDILINFAKIEERNHYNTGLNMKTDVILTIFIIIFIMVLGRNKTGNLQGDGEILFWPVHVSQ